MLKHAVLDFLTKVKKPPVRTRIYLENKTSMILPQIRVKTAIKKSIYFGDERK